MPPSSLSDMTSAGIQGLGSLSERNKHPAHLETTGGMLRIHINAIMNADFTISLGWNVLNGYVYTLRQNLW